MKHLRTFENFSGDEENYKPGEWGSEEYNGQIKKEYDWVDKQDNKHTFVSNHFKQFKNISQDEDNNWIGNCKYCGAAGVLINEHERECEAKKEEGIRKFLTGHSSKEDKENKKTEMIKQLDEIEEMVSKNPEEYSFNRSSIERKAKDNNYRGGIRVQRGGNSDKIFVVYDEGMSGLESLSKQGSLNK